MPDGRRTEPAEVSDAAAVQVHAKTSPLAAM
jgi:hypothetical protein